MAGYMYQLFSESEKRQYRCQLFSVGTFLCIFVNLAAVLVTFSLLSFSAGPWKRESSYSEQPRVNFKKQLLLKLMTRDSYYVSTSYENIKLAFPERQKLLQAREKEVDENGDGKLDYLDLSVPLYLTNTEKVTGVEAFLVFDYQLEDAIQLEMESMVYIASFTNSQVAGFNVSGDLKLQLTEPMVQERVTTAYNTSIINTTSVYPRDFLSSEILMHYQSRNVTTKLEKGEVSWLYGVSGGPQPFVMNFFIRYSQELAIRTRPSFWEELLYGFTKFLPIFIMVYYVLDSIVAFIFQHQLISVVISRPASSAKTKTP